MVGRSREAALPSRTVEETREAYRELVRAGLVYPVSTFAGGPESLYRLTEVAGSWKSGLQDRSLPVIEFLSYTGIR
jgi:hypothetical protein